MKAIRMLIAFAAHMEFILYQMDVKSALLNGYLKEEVLVKQHPGFEMYVDDIIFGATNEAMCKEFAEIMGNEIEMSMMGELNFFLGQQIKQTPTRTMIHKQNISKNY
ncbi:uncharacterized protein [Nicotiana tomentosiformis]|uniref:uncharacterized protein n=1 Tax=Nicotiana tomentosiformis TaxID=4098 RepID=UPI00388C5289